jgi:hypothetical protein
MGYRVGYWLLTAFIWVWGTSLVVAAVADLAPIISAAPSLWSGLSAVGSKWFDASNTSHWFVELFVASPVLGAWWLRGELKWEWERQLQRKRQRTRDEWYERRLSVAARKSRTRM